MSKIDDELAKAVEDSEADEARIYNKMRGVKRQFCRNCSRYGANRPVNARFLQKARYDFDVILDLT